MVRDTSNFGIRASILSVSITVFVLMIMIIGTGIVTPILAQQVGEQVVGKVSADANVNIDLKFACINLLFYVACW